MKETPLLMKPELIRQTIDGNKTETRRLRGLRDFNKVPDQWAITSHKEDVWTLQHFLSGGNVKAKCPYGVVGDRLYIKEPHYRYGKWVKNGKTKTGGDAWRFRSQEMCDGFPRFAYEDDRPDGIVRPDSYRHKAWYKRSPLFMEKQHARLWLEKTGGGLERLQEIRALGCLHEGVMDVGHVDIGYHWEFGGFQTDTAREAFECGWDNINPDYPWSLNPWVWVVQYKLVSTTGPL